MEEVFHSPRLVRFGTFEVDVDAGELRKSGVKLKLTGQPFQVLTILLERPGEVVTREELQKRLWPDTFVDVDHNLNTAINKIREVLGDAAESPRFVETLPRRGYRFIAPVENHGAVAGPVEEISPRHGTLVPSGVSRPLILFAALLLLLAAGFFVDKRLRGSPSSSQRTLTRLTFDDGLQFGATWSPDNRYIAYSSDRGGKFDIWVQQVSGGDPVQITKGPGQHWQPEWSPDGKYIAYRSEEGEGGLFIVPALGGAGQERKIVPFGYNPRWSPDSSQILFQNLPIGLWSRFYVVGLDGSAPHEVLGQLMSEKYGISAAWHPDGKRISVWVWEAGASTPIPAFWTGPVSGGPAVKTEFGPEVLRMGAGVAGDDFTTWADFDYRFSWAPSGKAIYFERTLRRAKNIWKMSIDPENLRATALERVTTGPGLESDLALSPDGSKLAFTGMLQHVRAWLFPFDPIRGRLLGAGRPITSTGMEAWNHSLSPDGSKLAFGGKRAGNWELRLATLSDGQEAPVLPDDSYERNCPQWSPDGLRLVYLRERESTHEHQLMVWSVKNHNEEPLAEPPGGSGQIPYDWSPDGKWVFVSQSNPDTLVNELWRVPATGESQSVGGPQKIAADPAYDIYQGHLSPDGRWIVFEAVLNSDSILFVVPAAGGSWIRISKGKHWDDKPHWSPDGKTIYFLSEHGGFLNVWGIHFDTTKGQSVGEPFQISEFGSPRLMVPNTLPTVELSLARDKLVLTMEERSGGIWTLDNVGP